MDIQVHASMGMISFGYNTKILVIIEHKVGKHIEICVLLKDTV